jgi:hypothetical protein
MPVTKVRSRWENGRLVFEDISGNEIFTIDGDNQQIKYGGTAITADADEINELDISAVGAVSKIKTINMTASDFSDNTEVSTGWSLPDNVIVRDVFLNVNTKEDSASTKEVDVGTDGSGSDDPNGFLDGASVASAGVVKGTIEYNSVTLGDLLQVDTGDGTNPIREPDVTSSGDEITVTAGDGSGFDDVDFDIIIDYIELAG